MKLIAKLLTEITKWDVFPLSAMGVSFANAWGGDRYVYY